MKTLIAIPVYNEAAYIKRVLPRVQEYARDILVIDDGSTDATPELLREFPDIRVHRHEQNRGYGQSVIDAFDYAMLAGYDWVITIDCDEQHEPEAIPMFVREALTDKWDVVSGSRYMPGAEEKDAPPPSRRRINSLITSEINECLGLQLTDSFCGFKAYRVSALRNLSLDVDGYAFPMQFWAQAVAHRLRITEVPVKLIYNDPNRTFGGPLNHDETRLAHYRDVFHRELGRVKDMLPASKACAASKGTGPGNAAWCEACCR